MIRGEGAPYHLVGPPDCSCVQGLFCSRHHHVRAPSSPHPVGQVGTATDNGDAPPTDPQTTKGTEALATFLIDLSPNDMAHRLQRRADRVCRRHALPPWHRGPAGGDVARAHPPTRAGRPSRRSTTDDRHRRAGRHRAAARRSPARHRLRLLRSPGSVVAAAGRGGVCTGSVCRPTTSAS